MGILFAAFLGYNPIARLLGPSGVLHDRCRPTTSTTLTGKEFFPHLIAARSTPGLVLVFGVAAAMMVVAAVASWFAGSPAAEELSRPDEGERTGEEPADYAEVEGELADAGASSGPTAGLSSPRGGAS